MPARRSRKLSTLARGLRYLSLLAVCGLIVGAVFVLTSNQGCMRVIRRAPASAPAPQVSPEPAASTDRKHSNRGEAAEPAEDQSASSPQESDAEHPPQETAEDTRTASTPFITAGEVSRGSTSSPKIALTFDAGAAGEPVDKILKTLAKHGLHCTFFLTGKWIERYPDLARRIVAEGHEIGNHTYSHPRLTSLSDKDIGEQVERTEQLALRITGASTKPLFRPPFGARDKHVLGVLGKMGYRSIYWHVDCWDSIKRGITSDEITQRVLKLVRNGSIVLMHCGSQATANALDGLLTELEARGYKPVTVGRLLGQP